MLSNIMSFKFVLESYVVECSMESFMHKIIEVNLSAFVYRLFHEDFSPISRTNYFSLISGANLV